MFPITDYPAVVKNNLDKFADLFSKPQLRHFAEYLTGLLVCERANIKQINNNFVRHREYSNKDRFMTNSSWSEKEVDQRRLELIKQFIGHMNPGKGCLVLDDTILEKFGKKIDEVGKLYDHAQGRFVLGHNLVTSQYVTPRGIFPIGFQLYLKRDKNDKDFKTKIELAQQLVAQAVDIGIPFDTVVFDAWFLSKDLAKFIESKERNWVGAAKKNRNIFVSGQKFNIEEFRCTLDKSCFKEITVGEKVFYCFTKTVKMSKLGKVRLLIAHEEKDLSDTPKYLVTNNCRWEARRIIRTYQNRWHIETFYRDSKQNLGLQDYEMRNLLGIKRHWYLVFLSYTLLTLSSMDRNLQKWIDANVRTIGQKCRMATSEIIRNFVLWVLKLNSLTKNKEEILTIIFEPNAKIGQRFKFA
jgi:SRSO17 transposase